MSKIRVSTAWRCMHIEIIEWFSKSKRVRITLISVSLGSVQNFTHAWYIFMPNFFLRDNAKYFTMFKYPVKPSLLKNLSYYALQARWKTSELICKGNTGKPQLPNILKYPKIFFEHILKSLLVVNLLYDHISFTDIFITLKEKKIKII